MRMTEQQLRVHQGIKPPTETQEHLALMAWARCQPYGGRTVAEFMHHSPNGGRRSKREAAEFQRMGTLPGFPDLFLFVSVPPASGLFIELKRTKGGSVSAHQKQVMQTLRLCGYRVEVCLGAESAKAVICDYLGIGG